MVLDHEYWVAAFGRRNDAIGQTVLVNRAPATIVGVAPQSFHGFGPERPPLWISMGMLPAFRGAAVKWDDPAESGWRIVGRLASGAAEGQVNAELRTLATRQPEVFQRGPLTVAVVGRELVAGTMSGEKRIEFLLVVVMPLVVVTLILWIGCSNVANLLLSRAATRRKEMAIRLANGASRARLIRLLLTESLLLSLAGGGLGLLLAAWTLDLIRITLPEAPRLAIELDSHVLIYTSAVCLLATMLFGLVPAVHGTRVDVAPLLKSDMPSFAGDARRGVRMRRFFLITQFASSMALVVVAGTFVRTVVTGARRRTIRGDGLPGRRRRGGRPALGAGARRLLAVRADGAAAPARCQRRHDHRAGPDRAQPPGRRGNSSLRRRRRAWKSSAWIRASCRRRGCP